MKWVGEVLFFLADKSSKKMVCSGVGEVLFFLADKSSKKMVCSGPLMLRADGISVFD